MDHVERMREKLKQLRWQIDYHLEKIEEVKIEISIIEHWLDSVEPSEADPDIVQPHEVENEANYEARENKSLDPNDYLVIESDDL